MTAILAYNNRFHATAGKAVAFTDQGASFAAAQPLANLAEPQLGLFAEWDGATAELDIQATDGGDPASAETFSADVLGLLGLQQWETGTLVEFLNGTDVIAAATWRPVPYQEHLVLPLPAAVSLDTLTVRINSAGTGAHRIGAVWAGPSWRFALDAKWPENTRDTGITSDAPGGTRWAFGGRTLRTTPANFRARNIDQSHGIHLPQSSIGVPSPFTTDNSTSESGGVYTFTAVSSTLLAEATYLTGGQHYEVTVETTYGAGNVGTPGLAIGSGNSTALPPGESVIVGTPDDGSDTDLELTVLNGASFTGTIEIKSIKTAQARQPINARDVLRTAASTSPVIWMPRTTNGWLPESLVYGYVEPGWSINHIDGPLHDVSFQVAEVR